MMITAGQMHSGCLFILKVIDWSHGVSKIEALDS